LQTILAAIISTRGIVLATVSGLLGFLNGSAFAPVSHWPRMSLERENAALRQELKLHKQMVETYRAEHAEITEMLKGK